MTYNYIHDNYSYEIALAMRNYVTSPKLSNQSILVFTDTNSISLSRRLRTMLLTIRFIKTSANADFDMISRKMMDNVRGFQRQQSP